MGPADLGFRPVLTAGSGVKRSAEETAGVSRSATIVRSNTRTGRTLVDHLASVPAAATCPSACAKLVLLLKEPATHRMAHPT
jgi:hypothetical protein